MIPMIFICFLGITSHSENQYILHVILGIIYSSLQCQCSAVSNLVTPCSKLFPISISHNKGTGNIFNSQKKCGQKRIDTIFYKIQMQGKKHSLKQQKLKKTQLKCSKFLATSASLNKTIRSFFLRAFTRRGRKETLYIFLNKTRS